MGRGGSNTGFAGTFCGLDSGAAISKQLTSLEITENEVISISGIDISIGNRDQSVTT